MSCNCFSEEDRIIFVIVDDDLFSELLELILCLNVGCIGWFFFCWFSCLYLRFLGFSFLLFVLLVFFILYLVIYIGFWSFLLLVRWCLFVFVNVWYNVCC